MGLRSFNENIRLTDLKGELIALRYVDDQEITSTPEWNDGEPITQLVPRAEVVVVTKHKDGSLTAKRAGRSLVFQKAIANDIRGDSEWAFGLFDEFAREMPGVDDATMYELADPEGVSLPAVETAFKAAGIPL